MRKREGRHVTSRSYVYVSRNHAAGSQAMCPAGPARNLSMRNGHPSCCQPHCVTHSASNRVKLWWLEGAVGAKQRWATHPISIPSALTLSGVRTSIRSRPGHGASGFYHANMVKVRRLWCKIHHFLRGFRSNSAGCGDCSSHISTFPFVFFQGLGWETSAFNHVQPLLHWGSGNLFISLLFCL